LSHTVLITSDNPTLADLELSWGTIEYTAEDGIGPLRSLHEADVHRNPWGDLEFPRFRGQLGAYRFQPLAGAPFIVDG